MPAIFPLPIAPLQPFDSADSGVQGLRFGVNRHNSGRMHAGVDLCAPFGTPVFAVEDGIVNYAPYQFYGADFPNMWVIAIRHPTLRDGKGILARHGEIEHVPQSLRKGVAVKQGQILGTVSNQGGNSMLHIELYATDESVDCTSRGNMTYDNVSVLNYQRRHDLLNPTLYLKEWQQNLVGSMTIREKVGK